VTPAALASPPADLARRRDAGAFAELDYEELLACVHCGFCLPTCPTYAELGQESDSPRGRIYLIKALADGRLALTDSVTTHLSRCLDCRACETACPAGVRYGHLIEAAKVEIERQRPGSWARRTVRRLALAWLLPSPRALRLVAGALRLYQRTGLQRLVRRSGVLRLFPSTVQASEALLPPLPPAGRGGRLPEVTAPHGPRRARVGLLRGCVQDVIFRDHNEATIRCLVRQGAEVVVPPSQRCCGALHAHAGDPGASRALARENIAAFEASGVDAVLANAAGCGAHLKGYGHLLEDDPAWAARAATFAGQVRDVTEFLAQSPLVGPIGAVPLRATYHDPCHLVHGQRVHEAPRALLRAIPGLELVDLAESEMCCGSAGSYNLTQPELARRLLDRKIRHVVETGAETVVTANPGCILQLAAGLRAAGRPTAVRHVVELLDQAYRAGERASGAADGRAPAAEAR
jgi:glycolate oxidase iron-sulfur subunit